MSTTPAVLPCPFCGTGETMLHVNKGTWNGQRYGEPVSVEVRHWCEPEDGQPARMVARVGRDEASAIAAWNRRAAIAGATPDDIAHLIKFYGATNLHDLIRTQAGQIERLQAKMPAAPSFAPQRAREG